ncbi:amidohydrolase family protein [Chiayiivirga flava]|uniref:Imidazolonepropionase-like amidohydrolase n=1 Tax=Chiayiivirga flava TaxID=659595 RepID=A0A7W8G2A4_9GAMM|nr:amidohydrolase family protein [Chiayiivirga flava]MBB5209753.1 imidazolonepropionase-like amidohydrolase [Chiayiivirga flava]
MTSLRIATLALAGLLASAATAHDGVPAAPQSGPVVIDGATVHTVSGDTIERGRVRFEDGKIVAVGGGDVSTAGATVVDATGKHAYPGLIAAYSVLGLVEVGAVRATVDVAEVGANAANVRAEVAVNPDSELIPVTRSNGVLLALSAPQVTGDGVIGGTSALLQLEGWTWEDMTVRAPIALHVYWPSGFVPAGFPEEMAEAARKAVAGKRDALARAFEQARAYAGDGTRTGADDLRLAAMKPFVAGERPVFFHAEDVQSLNDALDFAQKYALRPVLVGAGEAWRLTDRLRALRVPVIVGGTHTLPLRRFDPVDATFANAAKLKAAGIDFAIATPGDGFDTTNLRNLPYHAATAAAYGLSKDDALRAITLWPARILGVDDRVGSLDVGKDATLFLTDGDPLEARTTVERAWIGGREIDLANRQMRLYDKYRQKYPQTRDAR